MRGDTHQAPWVPTQLLPASYPLRPLPAKPSFTPFNISSHTSWSWNFSLLSRAWKLCVDTSKNYALFASTFLLWIKVLIEFCFDNGRNLWYEKTRRQSNPQWKMRSNISINIKHKWEVQQVSACWGPFHPANFWSAALCAVLQAGAWNILHPCTCYS